MSPDIIASASGWLLTYLVHSSLLLGVTWLVTERWVVSPHFRDALWKAAVVGGFVTASLQGWSGLEPLAGRVILPRPAAAVRPVSHQTERREWTGLPYRAEPSPSAASGPAASDPMIDGAVSPPASRRALASWRLPRAETALLAVWALGAVLMGGLFLVQRARAIRELGRRQAVNDPALLGMLADLMSQAGIRRPVRLTVASGLSSPVALGGAEIVLPPAALAELGALEQRSLLAHELAHLARRDPQWLAVGCLVERVFFLQPLNRIARHRLQEAAEYLCDDWAVRRTGSGDSLATCLVKVAEWVGTSPRPIPLAGMAERPSQLVQRVHRLIEGKAMPTRTRTLLLTAAALMLIGATAVAAPSMMPAPRPAAEAEPESPALDEVPRQPALDAELQGTPADTDEVARTRLSREVRAAQREAQIARTHVRVDARRATLEANRALQEALAAPMPPMAPMAPIAPAITEAMRRAERSLARLGAERTRDTTSIAVPPLIAAMKDPDVEVRRAAAQSLANLDDPRAVPAFIEATRDGDAEVRATAAMALGQFEDSRGQPALIALLKDSDKHVRYAALSALHSMPGQVPVDAVLAALNDPDADIRQAAIGLAFNQVTDREEGTAADPRYVAAFTRLLADQNPEVRGQAASALGEMGLSQAPAALLAASKDKNSEVRMQVASALARIGDPKAVPVLKELLQDSDADVREQAVMALGEIRDRSALEALVAALKSSDPAVRRNAALALGQRGEQ
ncbi:MAG: M56 family metallopeptidase [Gemmatimonadota bacterium]|nr:M56 family metallopeptidase [Gemmatimonadota bacterium]